MSEINARTRQELVDAVAGRYRAGTTAEKSRILDAFVALTAYHRKHAIGVLNGSRQRATGGRRGRRRLYDEAVREALIVLWEASDRMCGKRLKPLLPVLLAALERHGHLRLDGPVREQLLAVSAATIDRLLAPPRTAAGGRRHRPHRTALRRSVPIRTFADWHDPAPRFVEADLVLHGRTSVAGSFLSTLTLTDIATGLALMHGRARAVGSFDAVGSDFATLTAEQDSARRTVREVSEDMRAQLGAFFDRRLAAAN